ncbi:MarR family winged helix-turn-helix transcriptional regulator [Oceanobacillus piezotolerans]|uniref:MarR family winged helix-turn-helix transcriptional regulator n=1 Tax=Oceanobacillus piezotolerans TaxID=2448030 RepID=UPI0013147EE1|nr:MarR family transcriptional regulator [Oceanobacillus piezotolerans]
MTHLDPNFFHQQLQFTRTFTKKLNEQLKKAGIFHSQWLIVFYLKQFETATLVEISNYLNVEKPTITRTVHRLEEQELIKKIPSNDKRERRIMLTEKGIKVFEEAKQVVDEFERKLLEDLSSQDLNATENTIKHLIERLQEG